jgi:energy-coupling factor transporter ATP-binding protein EcfA2
MASRGVDVVDCYIINGHHGAGKSSTIRALTGVRNEENSWPILMVGGTVIDAHIFVRSASEGTPFLPKAVISRVGKASHVFLPLRTNAHNGCPDVNGYIQ